MTPCPTCSTELAALASDGRLGCPDCYRHFHEELRTILERFHGASAHIGMMPAATTPAELRRREIARFRSLLDRAVAAEDFEEAARLRDQIQDLELLKAREATS